MQAKTAKIVEKCSPMETLKSFSVGDSLVIPYRKIKYQNLKAAQPKIEAKTGYRFTISTEGCPDGTFVRRDA